ncbi:extracellular solute-binding protein [Paenibacillus aurantius]|uniref:Extracellular solute-binding protein n=1 Tax=Paenibacillus aurantius TaxID=2918900 RepID=A0AA96LFV7_9BACL|nr:extracellular solute-binding protein [Paenibacillus aurantius]WNQ13147.1 extracellular solute-binding protein [Paenibacillus aurantius]
MKQVIKVTNTFLTFAMAVGITGCTKSGQTTESPGVKPAETLKAQGTPAPTADPLKGTIRVNLRGASAEVWNKMAESYTALHPNVKVIVDVKPAQGYREWVQAQFAAGKPEADFIMTNENSELAKEKFVDFKPYLEKVNPYTSKPWKEALNLEGMGINLEDPQLDQLNSLNIESVQILWMYNKEIFQKAGISSPPKTFNELMAAFQKIKDAGYTPFSIGGNALSLWSGQAGWLMRIFPDQYFRDYINQIRSKSGDYTYLPKDETWKFDLKDPYNDARAKVSPNELRMLKAIHDKEGPYKIEGNPAWRDVYENLKKLFGYAPQGFMGMSEDQAYKLFLTGKAATMVALPSSYWQLPKDFKDAEKTGESGGVKPFEFGYFNMPSMEGPLVQAPARTIHVNTGFYGFVKKDAEQTALDIDFMMYFTSPKGFKVYMEAVQNSKDASMTGAPMLNNIELPESMKKAFESFSAIGNTEGLPSPGNVLARGLYDYQPSVQSYVGLISKYFSGQIGVDEFMKQYQADIDSKFETMMKERKKWEISDLEHPERKPPVRQ